MILINQYSKDYDFKFREFYTELCLEITASVTNYLFQLNQQTGLLVNGELQEKDVIDDIKAEIQEKRTIKRFHLPPSDNQRQEQQILSLLAKIHTQDITPFIEETESRNPSNLDTIRYYLSLLQI